MRPRAVPLAAGVWRVPTFPADGINSFLLRGDDGAVTVVDAGLPRAQKRVLAALDLVGVHRSDVQQVVLTHAHPDHAGGLRALVDAVAAARTAGGSGGGRSADPGPLVSIGRDDAGYLASGQAPPRDPRTTVGRLLQRLPGQGWQKVEAGRVLDDGEVLDVAGGVRVVATPGHTPGHVSLLHEPTAVLITGDALFNVRGRRSFSPKFFCSDVPASRETAHRLGDELDYEVAAFTHGPHVAERAKETVREFLRSSAG